MCSVKKQPPVVFYKKSALKYFTKFIGKPLCRHVFLLIKLQTWGLYEERDSDGFLLILQRF